IGSAEEFELSIRLGLPGIHRPLRELRIARPAPGLRPFAGLDPVPKFLRRGGYRQYQGGYQIPTNLHHIDPNPSHTARFTRETKKPTRHHSPCFTYPAPKYTGAEPVP